jgi:hypothetical protein
MVLAPLQFSGRTLAPDLLGGIQQGQQVLQGENILQQQQLGIQKTQQRQAQEQQQAQQLAQQKEVASGLVQRGARGESIQTGSELAQLFVDNPELAQTVFDSAGARTEFQRNDLAEFGFQLEQSSADPQAQQQLIQQRVQNLTDQGRDPSDTAALLQADPNRRAQFARTVQLAALNNAERLEIAKNGQQGFTLGQGQQRFDASGRPIAQVAPKAEQFTLAPGEQRFKGGKVVAEGIPLPGAVLPPALTVGLDDVTSSKAEAAFVAAGGGKDGVTAFNKQVDIGNKISDAEANILEEEKKATVKSNVSRIATLNQGTKARNASLEKAKRFKRQLQEGTSESGATRTFLSFIPGVFTDQASFDEQFNSFAEVAAREKLKAAGEIRPTDADVEGMKRAIFGVGRDEETNIKLLDEFINEQNALGSELTDLQAAKKAGTLSVFAGKQQAAPVQDRAGGQQGPQEGDTAVNRQTGQRIVFQNGQWQSI